MTSKTAPNFESDIVIQSWLRPDLNSGGNSCDYREFRDRLESISSNLRDSLLEDMVIDLALDRLDKDATQAQRNRESERAVLALRVCVLRHLLGEIPFREFARRLESNVLLANFCGIFRIDGVRNNSKSTLHRAAHYFSDEDLRRLNQNLHEVVCNEDSYALVKLQEKMDASVLLADTTCLEANIHYPVDWLLLKDVSLNFLKAIDLIRDRNILCRMPLTVEEFARKLNRLCIEMTHTARTHQGSKRRKTVFRELKHLLKVIAQHAQRHCQKLELHWQQTDLSELQFNNLKERIEEKINLIEPVISQAHKRIIGGQTIKSSEKILSAHEADIEVIVRGKAGKQVEFGNALFIVENKDGFIVDYKLYGKQAPSEADKLIESIRRQNDYIIEDPIKALVTDRGFDAKKVAKFLEENDIENHICPRNIEQLKVRMKTDADFKNYQKRRSLTEARIAILKQKGLRTCRAKGLESRRVSVGLAVLAHNLILISKKALSQEYEQELQAA